MKVSSTKWYARGLLAVSVVVVMSGCAKQAADEAPAPPKNRAAERQEKQQVKPPADFPIYTGAEFQDNKVVLDEKGYRHYNGLYRTTDSTEAVIAFYGEALPKAGWKITTQPEAHLLTFFRKSDPQDSHLALTEIMKGKYRVLEVDVVFPR